MRKINGLRMIKKSLSLSCWNFTSIKYYYLAYLITCIGSGSELSGYSPLNQKKYFVIIIIFR